MIASSISADVSAPERDIHSSAVPSAARSTGAATTALRRSATLTFATMLTGQWLFFTYIAAFYGISTLQGQFQRWNLNRMLFKGYVAGDRVGNLAFAAHVLLAGIIAFGGALQLVPQIRARFPAVHRWNGGIYLLTAAAVSVAGLYLTWTRRSAAPLGQIAISVDAALILAFGTLAVRAIRGGEMAKHRRWALRTFMAISGSGSRASDSWRGS